MCRGQEMARWSCNSTPEPVSNISGVQMTAPVWAATVRTLSPGSLGLSTQKRDEFRPLEGKGQCAWCVIQYRLGVISHESLATLKVRHLRRLPLPVKSSPLRHQGSLAVHLFFVW